MITLQDYWKGRDKEYLEDFTIEIVISSNTLLERVNLLLTYIKKDGIVLKTKNNSIVSSGWRPKSYNNTIKNSSKTSKHITGNAVDIYDPDQQIDTWCLNNLQRLEECMLWLEDPSNTPNWCHLQSLPPNSGKRVFKP